MLRVVQLHSEVYAGSASHSANLSDSKLAEALICRRTVSVCTALKRCKAGTLRLLSLMAGLGVSRERREDQKGLRY